MGQEHIIDFSLGRQHRAPDGSWDGAMRRDIADRVKPNRRSLNMMSMLATGWLPWGVDWQGLPVEDQPPPPFIALDSDGRRYVMCCGHSWTRREAQAMADAGLVAPGWWTDAPVLTITEAGRIWLAENWPVPKPRWFEA